MADSQPADEHASVTLSWTASTVPAADQCDTTYPLTGYTIVRSVGDQETDLGSADAFNVSNGEIIKAQRKAQGSNQSWTITVQPDGNASVSITLPETTNCDATGAICTYDKRKLSNSRQPRSQDR